MPSSTTNILVLAVLAIAAELTAFYTARQITLTFLGTARTAAAEHAHETKWTMTLPLVILSLFAVGIGWSGIKEDFVLIGGLLPNITEEFVGSMLGEIEKVPFSFVPNQERERSLSMIPTLMSLI